MATIWVREFTGGLDTRRMAETASGAVLIKANNGHISRGGDFEKRAAFVPTYALPVGKTVGLAHDKSGIYVFSHLAPSDVGALPNGVQCQRLQHPDGTTALVRILSFDLYAGKIYVVAEFNDGGRYHFYDGVLVPDFKDGRARASFTVTGGGVTPAVAATGTFTVSGGSAGVGNQITDIKINGVSLIFGAVNFGASAAATAAVLASAITNHVSSPDYTAVASGAVVTVRQVSADASVNGAPIVVTTGGDVVVSAGSMSGGAATTTAALSTLTVNGVNIIGAPVLWRDSNEATAAAIVEEINSFSSDVDYVATSVGAKVNILPAAPGAAANGRVVAYATTDGLTVTPASGFTLAGGLDPVALAAATGSFTVSGGSTSSDTFLPSVGGVNIVSAAVPWTSSHTSTAAAIATAINSYTSSPDYTATSSGAVVTITAAVKGSSANGLGISVVTVGSAAVSSVVNMAGGADNSANYPPGTFVKTIGSRVHCVSGPNEHGSGIRAPNKWTTDTTGAFFIDMSTQASGAEELRAVAKYQKWVAVFAERVTQIWYFDSDPTLNTQAQVLNNTGTTSPRSVTQFGDNDLFYCATSGLRSLRARDASNAAATTDIGVPVDTLVTAKLNEMSADERLRVVGLIEPRDGRFWLVMGDTIFVFSYFPGAKISAWSTYEPGFTVEEADVFNRHVYVRSGDTIYVYGGLGKELQYDAAEAEAWLPYLDGESPARVKHLTGFDAAVQGEWQVSMAMRPEDYAVYDNGPIVFSTTYGLESICMYGSSTHFSPRLRSVGTGPAKLGALVLHYTPDVDDD